MPNTGQQPTESVLKHEIDREQGYVSHAVRRSRPPLGPAPRRISDSPTEVRRPAPTRPPPNANPLPGRMPVGQINCSPWSADCVSAASIPSVGRRRTSAVSAFSTTTTIRCCSTGGPRWPSPSTGPRRRSDGGAPAAAHPADQGPQVAASRRRRPRPGRAADDGHGLSVRPRCSPRCRPRTGRMRRSSPRSRRSRTRSSAPPARVCWSSRVAPARARRSSPCTAPRTCSTPTATSSPGAGCSWSAPTRPSSATSSRCCPRSARPRWCCPPSASCSPGWSRRPPSPRR